MRPSRDVVAGQPDYLEQGDAKEQAGDFDAARQLFERGGRLRQHYCWSRLANMFDVGIGCFVDKAKAMSYYRQSWRMGEWVGAANIAILYREVGNHRAMFQWFRRAADAGDGDALVEIAKCYIAGTGVRKDSSAARQTLIKAVAANLISEDGREEAERLLADL